MSEDLREPQIDCGVVAPPDDSTEQIDVADLLNANDAELLPVYIDDLPVKVETAESKPVNSDDTDVNVSTQKIDELASSNSPDLTHDVTLRRSVPNFQEQNDCHVTIQSRPLSEFKDIPNLNSMPFKGLYIVANVENDHRPVPIRFLLDSGSSDSLLDINAYNRIPEKNRPSITESSKSIRFADNRIQKALGEVTMNLSIGDSKYSFTCLLGNFSDEAIIGLNDMHHLNLKTDFTNLMVTHKDNVWLPIHDVHDNLIGRKVLVRKSVMIPANSKMEISTYVENCKDQSVFNDKPVLLLPDEDTIDKYGIGPAKSVYQYTDPNTPVLVFNTSNTPVELPCDAVIGTFSDEVESITGIAEPSNDVSFQNDLTEYSRHSENTEMGDIEIPDHLLLLYQNSCECLNDEEKAKLKYLLFKNEDVFSKGDFDLGKTDIVKHEIKLLPGAKPVKIPPRRLAPDAREAADKIVDNLLKRGLIRASESNWSSPIVLVKKRDSTFRLCLDYRMVNARSKQDGYPQPLISETLDHLANSKYFCTLDLAAGFWQLAMDPSSIDKTAFCTSKGLWEWLVMPFGLCSATNSFQRLMNKVVGDLNHNGCLVYIDDLIIHANDFDTTLSKLQTLLNRLRSAGLKCKPKKCHLFQKSCEFLGYKISQKGIETCPSKISEIRDWQVPSSKKGVKSFLGICGYYRRFVQDYSRIAKPLTALTSDAVEFEWSEDCQKSFEHLKSKLIESPILGFPQDKGTFVIDVDARNVAIGAVIQQEQNGELVVITYASKTLSSSEQNYCTTKKELFAIVYFIGLHKHYLSNKFTIRTDHASLKYWQRFKDPQGQIARWLDFLSAFSFDVIPRPGKLNSNADSMSRKHEECVHLGKKKCLCTTFHGLELEPPVVLETRYFSDSCTQTDLASTTCQGSITQCKRVFTLPIVKENALQCAEKMSQTSTIDLPDVVSCDKIVSLNPFFTKNDIKSAQKEDSDIGPVMQMLAENSQKPEWKTVSHLSSESKILLTEWKNLEIQDGILYKKWHSDNADSDWWQLVLPRKYYNTVIQQSHDHITVAHQGETRTLQNLKLRFWFPKMRELVSDWVKTCPNCQAKKSPNKRSKAPIQSFRVGAPFEKVSIDLTGPYSETENGFRYVATFIDDFTKFTVVAPMKTMTSQELCNALVKNWISYFGVPLQVHTDQGPCFRKGLFAQLCQLLDIHRTRCTPRHPESNGTVERVQRSLITMLNCVIRDNPHEWDHLIMLCALAFNNTPHETTKIAPAKLVFGRYLSLAIDLVAPIPYKETWAQEATNREDYVIRLQASLHDINKKARQNLKGATLKQNKYYNSHLHYHKYEVGDIVYYNHPVKERDSHKESYYPWRGPYFITRVLSDCLFCIQAGPNEPQHVVHYNKLKRGMCREAPDTSWIHSNEALDHHDDVTDNTQFRPKRKNTRPDYYGEWLWY